jgi:hypothetical protein
MMMVTDDGDGDGKVCVKDDATAVAEASCCYLVDVICAGVDVG